jgi:hypothetical protein
MHHSKIWQVTCRLIEVPRNDYLSDDTVLAADARRLSVKSYVTGGPAQAKLCCYDGWLRPQICTEEKVNIIVQTNTRG